MSKLQFYSSNLTDMMYYSNFVQRFIDERCRMEDNDDLWGYFTKHPDVGVAIANNFMLGNSERMEKVLEILKEPLLTVVVSGSKGSGKTAFSYWAGEEIHARYNMDVCAVNPLDFREDLLPPYFYDVYDVSDIRDNSFGISDETQLSASARRFMSKKNLELSDSLTVQRHIGIPLLVMQQVMEMTDKNVFRMADNFMFKKYGLVQTLQQRKNRHDPFFKFLEFLRPLEKDETLFMTADLQNIFFFRNPLASFWTEELSIPAKRFSFHDAIQYSRRLYQRGADKDHILKMLRLKGVKWTEQDFKWFAVQGRKEKKAKSN